MNPMTTACRPLRTAYGGVRPAVRRHGLAVGPVHLGTTSVPLRLTGQPPHLHITLRRWRPLAPHAHLTQPFSRYTGDELSQPLRQDWSVWVPVTISSRTAKSRQLILRSMPPSNGSRRTWEAVAHEIRELVVTGICPIGAKLPTKKDLAQRHNASGATVQRAMDQLADEGFVEARPGRGWFASKPVHISLLRSSPHWHERNAQVKPSGNHGWLDPTIRITTHKMGADPRVAADLHVPVGTRVCRRERRVSNGGRIIHLGRSYLPEAITRDTTLETDAMMEIGTYEELTRHGHAPKSITETVSVGTATVSESKILELDIARSPMVIRLVRIVHGERGRLEVDYLTARMGQLRLEYQLPIPR
ncbi:GntR family transcriptional regulator [Pseudonocardia sp. GCM10023141]|uniref:GntR family transcriptional regulator n=1 Tax=Pseudonocardia sp. GCM10023141 TaxID=3252653 RepID=UPI003614D046